MERIIEFSVEGVGTVQVVASHTDGLSEEELKRRWENFQNTARRLYYSPEERKKET